jgi:hypothetical protein
VLADRLAGVPSASDRAHPEVLDRMSRRIAEGLRAWLVYVGFEMRMADGGLYFEIRRYDF